LSGDVAGADVGGVPVPGDGLLVPFVAALPPAAATEEGGSGMGATSTRDFFNGSAEPTEPSGGDAAVAMPTAE